MLNIYMLGSQRFQKKYEPKVRKNHQIRAPRVRVIDNSGKNLGLMNTFEAIKLAQEAELDLIEITAKTDPPITRIMEYGKYLYQQGKKQKGTKQITGEVKGIRIGMTTSEHDLHVKAKMVDKFLKKGYKVRVELIMKGREKALNKLANEKIEKFLNALQQEYSMEQEPRKYPRGMQFTVSSQ